MGLKYGITKTWTARDKFEEAKFFHRKMLDPQEAADFKFFLSAFLSALAASTAEQAMRSNHANFNEWHAGHWPAIHGTVLSVLRELRNAETHLAGSPLYQAFKFDFGPDGVVLEGAENQSLTTAPITLGDPTTYRYRIDEGGVSGESRPLNASVRWVWSADGSPDVFDLCAQGLSAVTEIIEDWDKQGFNS